MRVSVLLLFSLLLLIELQWSSEAIQPALNLPGIEVLGMGWDAVHGQTRSARVVKYTYNQVNTFRNPRDESVIYQYPDQVTAIPVNQLIENVESSVSYSASQQAHTTTSKIDLGADIDWGKGAFSSSVGVSTAAQFLSDRTHYSSYAQTALVVAIYQAELLLPGQLTFDPSFVAAINSLPAAYDPSAYQHFLSLYGTHYLESAYFGGSGVMQVGVNAESAQTKSSSEVAVQAGIQFNWFKMGASGEQADSWFTGSGEQESQTTTSLIGGDPQISQNLTMWNAWIKSFFYYPAPLFTSPSTYPFTVVPLHDLVRNTTIKANLMKAMQYYINANPYPNDPPCMAKVDCSAVPLGGQACCPLSSPICCPGSASGCATTQEACQDALGYNLYIQENSGGFCSGNVCQTSTPAMSLDCPMNFNYDFSISCSGAVCTLDSGQGDSCSFSVYDPPGCSVDYGPFCFVQGWATIPESN